MMERLLSVKDIQERYQCNPATARGYIRQMVHMEKPMMVKEKEVERWERDKTFYPQETYKTELLKKRRARA